MQQYNLLQQRAIDAIEDNVIVEAPAGSGKTSTLVGAILKYRSECPTNHIVAITFTRKAAEELKLRVRDPDVEISTIHSWAYRRLVNLAIEWGFKVQLLEDDTIKSILKKLSLLRKQAYLNQFQLFSYVMGNYNIDIDEKLKRTFEIIRMDYIKFKEKNGLYDFTDLPKYLLDKLEEYGCEIDDIDALFVDEFQDIDPVQLELFDLVQAQKKVYIGDSKQSIYSFRGSIEDVLDKLDGFARYDLKINYRSYQEIIDYATTVRDIIYSQAKANKAGVLGSLFMGASLGILESDIECVRGHGGKVYTLETIGRAIDVSENKPINEYTLLRTLLEDSSTYILCRSNRQVKKLQSMGFENVSTVHQAKGLEYDNVVLVNFPITNKEELNIGYVGMTRAKNKLLIADFDTLLYNICKHELTGASKQLF